MITFAATTGDVTLPYAQDWTPQQWAFMVEQATINPALAPTVSGAGIRALGARVAAGDMPSDYEIAITLGGLWTRKIETVTTVTLQEGEKLTPTGLIGPNYVPPVTTVPPSTSGAIPPGPTDNVPGYGTPTVAVPPVTNVVPPVTATGGQPSTSGPIPQVLPTVNVTATPGWVIPLAVAAVVLYLLGRD